MSSTDAARFSPHFRAARDAEAALDFTCSFPLAWMWIDALYRLDGGISFLWSPWRGTSPSPLYCPARADADLYSRHISIDFSAFDNGTMALRTITRCLIRHHFPHGNIFARDGTSRLRFHWKCLACASPSSRTTGEIQPPSRHLEANSAPDSRHFLYERHGK